MGKAIVNSNKNSRFGELTYKKTLLVAGFLFFLQFFVGYGGVFNIQNRQAHAAWSPVYGNYAYGGPITVSACKTLAGSSYSVTIQHFNGSNVTLSVRTQFYGYGIGGYLLAPGAVRYSYGNVSGNDRVRGGFQYGSVTSWGSYVYVWTLANC